MNARIATLAWLIPFLCVLSGSCARRAVRDGGEATESPAASPEGLQEDMRDIHINVLPGTMVTVQGAEVPLKSLPQYLTAIAGKIGVAGIRVIISAREDTPYGQITEAIDAARGAGFTHVSLAPRPLPKPAATP